MFNGLSVGFSSFSGSVGLLVFDYSSFSGSVLVKEGFSFRSFSRQRKQIGAIFYCLFLKIKIR
jgi:hypothetical protein